MFIRRLQLSHEEELYHQEMLTTSDTGTDDKNWFVLNHFSTFLQRENVKDVVDRFNETEGTDLQLFAPTYVVTEERAGKVVMRTAKLTFHYVFVRGSLAEVKKLCSLNNGFSLLLNHSSSGRYATLSDSQMATFRNIARVYENCLPYFPLDGIDLEEGDTVEVVNGEFPGLIGTFIPKPRSTKGNIVLRVLNNVGTITYNINVADVRVLEFARNSNRANDQIDAFIPHLLAALRVFHSNEALPDRLIAKLSLFCRRMEIVKIPNEKLEAKLMALLCGANYLLGNLIAADDYRRKYEKHNRAVTNEWTRALIALIFSIINPQSSEPLTAPDTAPSSRFQKMLLDEYAYYSATGTQTEA